MHTRYFSIIILPVLSSLLLFSSFGYADAPLHKSLGLDIEQANQVKNIQAKYRSQIRPVRSELHREQRKLRRAKKDFDSAMIAQQEKVILTLQAKFKQIHENENTEIRALLMPEQSIKFDAVLEQRKEVVGSSRDVKEY
ncbi:MAG: Spy/CpxP family protein refolding chaperone [Methylococcales bacterium]